MEKLNPLNIDVVLSIVLQSISEVSNLKCFRLVNKKWFKLSLRKWRKTTVMRVYACEPEPLQSVQASPEEVANVGILQVIGCYEGLSAITGNSSKFFPLPTELEQKPFINYHLITLPRTQLPKNSRKNAELFWINFASDIKFLRVNPPLNAEDEHGVERFTFYKSLEKTLLTFCGALEELQLGPWDRSYFASDFDIGKGSVRRMKIMPERQVEKGMIQKRDYLANVNTLSLHRFTQVGGHRLEVLSSAIDFFKMTPKVKNLTFDRLSESCFEDLIQYFRLDYQAMRLESLKFNEAFRERIPRDTENLFLEYLHAVQPPLKELKETLLFSADDTLTHYLIFQNLQDLIIKLDLTIKSKRIVPRFPRLQGLHFSKLTSLNLEFQYIDRCLLPVFNFETFSVMPMLKDFRCKWTWMCSGLVFPRTSERHFYWKWNDSISDFTLKGKPINMQFLRRFHLNVWLSNASLNILRCWMENLKILEVILEDEQKYLPFELWPGLDRFTDVSYETHLFSLSSEDYRTSDDSSSDEEEEVD